MQQMKLYAMNCYSPVGKYRKSNIIALVESLKHHNVITVINVLSQITLITGLTKDLHRGRIATTLPY